MATVPMLSAIADQAASQIAGAVSSLMPSGVVLPFGGTAAPTGWLLCDGSPISRTTYSALFSAIGTTHGTGDGVNTFNLPDMRGVFPRGAGTNGTSNYGGVTGHTPAGGSVGAKGGQKTAPNGLSGGSGNQSQAHSHSANHDHASANTASDGAHTHNVNYTILAGGTAYRPQPVGNGSDLTDPTNSAGAHTHSVDLPNLNVTTGNNSVDHTHAVTVSSTDTETTPASLALHYIIKI
jgi:microcystin-dependent protein